MWVFPNFLSFSIYLLFVNFTGYFVFMVLIWFFFQIYTIFPTSIFFLIFKSFRWYSVNIICGPAGVVFKIPSTVFLYF